MNWSWCANILNARLLITRKLRNNVKMHNQNNGVRHKKNSKLIFNFCCSWDKKILASCGKNGACKLTQMALQKSASPIMISVDHWRFVKFGKKLRILSLSSVYSWSIDSDISLLLCGSSFPIFDVTFSGSVANKKKERIDSFQTKQFLFLVQRKRTQFLESILNLHTIAQNIHSLN